MAHPISQSMGVIPPPPRALDTDNHMKMKMYNQHNIHAELAEQDEQWKGLEMKSLLNF